MRGWQNIIGYVPQSIYLTDDDLEHNIAFGLSDEQIDRDKVLYAVEAANLAAFVKGLPDGLATFVGERGIRLSGGQKQRIGIAGHSTTTRKSLFLTKPPVHSTWNPKLPSWRR